MAARKKPRTAGPPCVICGDQRWEKNTDWYSYACCRSAQSGAWICPSCTVKALADLSADPLRCDKRGCNGALVPGLHKNGGTATSAIVPLQPRVRQMVAALRADPAAPPAILVAVDGVGATIVRPPNQDDSEMLAAAIDAIDLLAEQFWGRALAPDDVSAGDDFAAYALGHPDCPAVAALRAFALAGAPGKVQDGNVTIFLHRMIEMLRKLRQPNHLGPLARVNTERLEHYTTSSDIWSLVASDMKAAQSKSSFTQTEKDAMYDVTGKLVEVLVGPHAPSLKTGLWDQVDNLEVKSIKALRDHDAASKARAAADNRASSAAAKIAGASCRHFIPIVNHKVEPEQWKRDIPGWDRLGDLGAQRQARGQPAPTGRRHDHNTSDEIVDDFHVQQIHEMNFGDNPSPVTPADMALLFRDHRERSQLNAGAAPGSAYQFIKPSLEDGAKAAQYCPASQSVANYPLIDQDLNSDAVCRGICDAVRDKVIKVMGSRLTRGPPQEIIKLLKLKPGDYNPDEYWYVASGDPDDYLLMVRCRSRCPGHSNVVITAATPCDARVIFSATLLLRATRRAVRTLNVLVCVLLSRLYCCGR